MDYVDAATTRILSPHVLPVEDLREMLLHIEKTLPLTMHLPISSEDAPTSTDTYAGTSWLQMNNSYY